jgi:acetolactate decarboxylase
MSPSKLEDKVSIHGSMQAVIKEGEYKLNIKLDTIENIENIYGIGLKAYLKGEIIAYKGKIYKSTVINENELKVEESRNINASFFGFSHIDKFDTLDLPNNVVKMKYLEQHLNYLTQSEKRSFFFVLEGNVRKAKIHVTDLPEGKKIESPQDIEKAKTRFTIKDEDVIIVGFFSTEGEYVLTRDNTHIHLHLLTKDLSKMGHVDDLVLRPQSMKLLLPTKTL